MPTLPAALATRAERWFANPAQVTTVERLSPGLHRVTIAGAALRGRGGAPGREVEFRVGDRDFRHYTASRYDADTGELDVIFHTAADGPGTRWAGALRAGAGVAVMGPAGGLRWRADRRTVLLGDATVIGLFAALLAAGQAVSGAVEVPDADRDATARLLPGIDVLTARTEPGSALHDWAADALADGARVYLAGHAQSIQSLRGRLRERGVPRTDIVTKAYWASGRAGL